MDRDSFEKEYVHKFYSAKAKVFSDSRVKPWPYTIEFIQKYVSETSIILDSGCGNGRQFVGPNIVGFDYSGDLLLEASRKPNIGLLQGNILNLPFRNSVFDVVLSIAVIHHLSDRDRRMHAMKEMLRVMKSDGVALIYVWHKDASYHGKFKHVEENDYLVSWRGEEDAMRFYYLFDEADLICLCRDAGFDVVECRREQESIFAVVRKN